MNSSPRRVRWGVRSGICGLFSTISKPASASERGLPPCRCACSSWRSACASWRARNLATSMRAPLSSTSSGRQKPFSGGGTNLSWRGGTVRKFPTAASDSRPCESSGRTQICPLAFQTAFVASKRSSPPHARVFTTLSNSPNRASCCQVDGNACWGCSRRAAQRSAKNKSRFRAVRTIRILAASRCSCAAIKGNRARCGEMERSSSCAQRAHGSSATRSQRSCVGGRSPLQRSYGEGTFAHWMSPSRSRGSRAKV